MYVGIGGKLKEIRPKTSHYNTDGQGRDFYISVDNGGLSKVKENTSLKIICCQNVISKPYVRSIAPVRYYGDGSGRDYYVINDSTNIKYQQQKFKPIKKIRQTPVSNDFNPIKSFKNLNSTYNHFFSKPQQDERILNISKENIENKTDKNFFNKQSLTFKVVKSYQEKDKTFLINPTTKKEKEELKFKEIDNIRKFNLVLKKKNNISANFQLNEFENQNHRSFSVVKLRPKLITRDPHDISCEIFKIGELQSESIIKRSMKLNPVSKSYCIKNFSFI